MLEPTFELIQDTIFTPHCNSCHGDANPREGLQLGEDATYGQLIDKASNVLDDQILVVPFEPDNSYLIKKLELETGSPDIDGAQMPQNLDPLPPETINIIRQWITNGALEVAE